MGLFISTTEDLLFLLYSAFSHVLCISFGGLQNLNASHLPFTFRLFRGWAIRPNRGPRHWKIGLGTSNGKSVYTGSWEQGPKDRPSTLIGLQNQTLSGPFKEEKDCDTLKRTTGFLHAHLKRLFWHKKKSWNFQKTT